jgi:ATP-dependent DNA helicase RecG
LFRAGYIESWGRGTIKILNECINYKIPPPIYKISASDFEVKIYRYTQESLERVGLKPELQTIVLYVQENGNITNKDVQRICDVSKRTASRYLSDLENTYLDKSGTTGAGTNYIFKGAIIGP